MILEDPGELTPGSPASALAARQAGPRLAHTCIYIYIYIYVCMYIYIYIHIHSNCSQRTLIAHPSSMMHSQLSEEPRRPSC